MRIILSSHARKRCQQRGVNPERIVAYIASLPPCAGTIEYRIPRTRIEVVFYARADFRKVITVIVKSGR